jgi:ABC-type nitrate/sulfonate/bicarbonate transport system permease component
MPLSRRLSRALATWWLPVLLIAAWWLLTLGHDTFYFPSLNKILITLWRDLARGTLVMWTLISLGNMAAGLAIAIVVGVALGLAIGEFEGFRRAAMPTLNFIRAIPPAAIVPLIIVAMGIGPAPKIFIIALACVWPVLLNTTDGVRGISPQLLDTSKAFRIPLALRLRRVLVMAALPQIMAGIRVAIAVALVLMVISEFFGASAGVGFYINDSKQRFAMPETWAGTLLIGVLGYVLSALFLAFERRVLAWYFQDTGAPDTAAP